MTILFRSALIPVLLCASCWSQSDAAAGKPQQISASNAVSGSPHLMPIETTLAPTEVARGLGELSCDSDGNLYLGSDSPATPGIRKLSPGGGLLATFVPANNSGVSKAGIEGSFAVGQSGDLYTLFFPEHERARYVLVFKSDGTYKKEIKLQPGFQWIPASISVFANGNLLITGQEFVKGQPMAPFTGIFSGDGQLLKEIDLEDDKVIDGMALSGNPHVVSSTNPLSNRAVSWGKMQAASDGNIYVMRWLSPTVVYAVAPDGKVARRFTIDSGRDDLMPMEMHISGERIAVLFVQRETHEKLMKVVDLDGNDLATYDYDKTAEGTGNSNIVHLGLAFACYSAKPERFTFLTTTDDHRIQLRLAEAR